MSMTIEEMIKKQQEYFAAGKTCELAQRIQALNRLEQGILNCEQELYAALKKDLGKSRAESYMCEVGLTLSELRFVKKHVQKWSREKRVPTPLAQFHARSFTVQEPYGVVLVMSPWNYPVLLTLEPLIGALGSRKLLCTEAVCLLTGNICGDEKDDCRRISRGVCNGYRRWSRGKPEPSFSEI